MAGLLSLQSQDNAGVLGRQHEAERGRERGGRRRDSLPSSMEAVDDPNQMFLLNPTESLARAWWGTENPLRAQLFTGDRPWSPLPLCQAIACETS